MKRSAYSSLSVLSLNVNLSRHQLFLTLLFILSFACATNNTVHGQSFSWSRYALDKNTSALADASDNSYALASLKNTDINKTYNLNHSGSSHKDTLTLINSDKDVTHRIHSSIELLVYPSPYFDQTTMSFIAPEDGVVHLAIFNIAGALVKEVFRREVKARHSYHFTADFSDFKESLLISKLTTGEQSSHQKLLLNHKQLLP